MSTLIWLVVIVLTLRLIMRRHRANERANELAGRLVPRPDVFQPLPMQRAVMDEILRRERDGVAAYHTAQFHYDQARARARTESRL